MIQHKQWQPSSADAKKQRNCTNSQSIIYLTDLTNIYQEQDCLTTKSLRKKGEHRRHSAQLHNPPTIPVFRIQTQHDKRTIIESRNVSLMQKKILFLRSDYIITEEKYHHFKK